MAYKSELMKRIEKVLEAKGTKEIPDFNLEVLGFSKDPNGNTILKLKNTKTNKGFSIQTNNSDTQGIHALRGKKTKELSDKDFEIFSKELKKATYHKNIKNSIKENIIFKTDLIKNRV